ncbi:response regulator transcription factor [uncultured Oscillibacter sp.]|uniref:response regulator transcription factor n=1 Tax=uncultured Oscillibacter sp. TaxID=876091 RepID=UPI00263A1D2D|nr:response regulator transcription factor [uncultured Oscillibacter sp.]
MEQASILVVDDEQFVRRTISRVLSSEGMAITEAADGPEAVRAAQSQRFDLIILDIVMDGMDGFQVINQLRNLGILTPVFILSGRQADNDKVFALGIGADDYITKPFSPAVLCAKVKACLRRVGLSTRQNGNVMTAGPFRYLCDEMKLLKNGEEILLSSKESFLMKYFLSNMNKVLTKEQIYSSIWGNNVVDDNTIMVHIRRLRMKIEDDPTRPAYLRTVRGVGYQFVSP